MRQIARSWRIAIAGLAVGVAAVLGSAGPTASADPAFPPRPAPAPIPAAPMPQAVAVVPGAAGVAANVVPGVAAAAAPAAPEASPASSGTLRDYFGSKGVKMEPQQAQNFKALDITLPMPAGWTLVPDPNVPDAFLVTANRRSVSLYTSNAQLVVYRLVGDFDPREAITHGYIDSQQLPAWRTTNASLADFNGSPSSIIEGTYRQNDMTLNTSRRHVIVASGPEKYLVSLSVTTDAAQAVGEAPATDGIINGFRAGPPGSNPPAAPPQAASAPVVPAVPPAVAAAAPQALAH